MPVTLKKKTKYTIFFDRLLRKGEIEGGALWAEHRLDAVREEKYFFSDQQAEEYAAAKLGVEIGQFSAFSIWNFNGGNCYQVVRGSNKHIWGGI